MNCGTLIVRPLCAKLTYDTEWFARMDPYMKCTIGGTIQKTQTAWNQGKTPNWTDTLTFRVNGETTMQISLYDEDTVTKDDYIGEGNIPLGAIYQARNQNGWFPINRRGRSAGSVMIQFEFYPDNNPQMGFGMGAPYGMAQPSFGMPAPSYGMPQPSYGMAPPAYGMPPPTGFGQPAMPYGAQPQYGGMGYGMPPQMPYGMQQPQMPYGMGGMGMGGGGLGFGALNNQGNPGLPPGFF